MGDLRAQRDDAGGGDERYGIIGPVTVGPGPHHGVSGWHSPHVRHMDAESGVWVLVQRGAELLEEGCILAFAVAVATHQPAERRRDGHHFETGSGHARRDAYPARGERC